LGALLPLLLLLLQRRQLRGLKAPKMKVPKVQVQVLQLAFSQPSLFQMLLVLEQAQVLEGLQVLTQAQVLSLPFQAYSGEVEQVLEG
jgi:hypothetical protein